LKKQRFACKGCCHLFESMFGINFHILPGCLYRAASAFMLYFELSKNGSFQTAVLDRSQPLIDSLLILRATHFTVFSRLYERSFVRYRLNEVRFLFFLSSSQVCRCVFYFWSSSTSFRLSSFLLLFRERPDGLKPRNFGKSLAEYPDSWICGRLPEKFSRNSELASGTWHGRRTVYLCKGKDSLEPGMNLERQKWHTDWAKRRFFHLRYLEFVKSRLLFWTIMISLINVVSLHRVREKNIGLVFSHD